MQTQTPAPAAATVLLPSDWHWVNDGADTWTPDWLATRPQAAQETQAVTATAAYLPADWND